MNIAQIQQNLEELVKNYSSDEFIFDLLRSYGLAKASITRLKKGEYNLSNNGEEVIWKNKVYYKEAESDKLYDVIDELSTNKKVRSHDLRFIVVTDHKRLLAEDTKTKENRDISIEDLPKHFDFFLPWAGMEKRQHVNENPADVKAAEKLAKLYDEIKKSNKTETEEEVHSLNVFLSRLLFCFFAEDTGIFEENIFTNSVSSHTKEDGSDLDTYFEKLFAVLNDKEREDTAAYLNEFPYVNGGLFKEHHPAPEFSRKSRQIVIECGELDWAAINPDIFGSMMQAVITPDQREGLGMHYTSVPNIMKVIEPLFLNDLYDDFEKNKFNPKKLRKLLDRISKFKIFDPACGSGNFLVIAYKQLRYFEIKVLKQLQKLQEATNSLDSLQKELIPQSQLSLASSHQLPLFSRIQLSQFYGIEIDDFAHEIAQLSLWLAEHQMNNKFYKEFGKRNPTLPLNESGKIICANACRIKWDEVCPYSEKDEIYLLGNPPYLGARRQSTAHKDDLKIVFKKDYNNLDYIAGWFLKGAKYINNRKAELAFVTTNSLTQGEQVYETWPKVLKEGIEIGFAHQDFKWQNKARSNAAVICNIVGLRNESNKKKEIISDGIAREVEDISPYLVAGDTIYVQSRTSSLSDVPEMSFGSMPNDNRGNLLLNSEEEKDELLRNDPRAEKYILPLVSAKEFLNNKKRWCLWLKACEPDELKSMPSVYNRVKNVREYRSSSSRKRTQELSEVPHLFGEDRHPNTDYVLIPRHTSENRDYIPIGFFGESTIAHDSCLIVPNATPYLFGILTSKMHMAWVNAVCGRLKTDIRYSKRVVYNNFPFPFLQESEKEEITDAVYRILQEREKHPEKSLADLYNPKNMPDGLREAHRLNDKVVEKSYRTKPFTKDGERLEYLFDLYKKQTSKES